MRFCVHQAQRLAIADVERMNVSVSAGAEVSARGPPDHLCLFESSIPGTRKGPLPVARVSLMASFHQMAIVECLQ